MKTRQCFSRSPMSGVSNSRNEEQQARRASSRKRLFSILTPNQPTSSVTPLSPATSSIFPPIAVELPVEAIPTCPFRQPGDFPEVGITADVFRPATQVGPWRGSAEVWSPVSGGRCRLQHHAQVPGHHDGNGCLGQKVRSGPELNH